MFPVLRCLFIITSHAGKYIICSRYFVLIDFIIVFINFIIKYIDIKYKVGPKI